MNDEDNQDNDETHSPFCPSCLLMHHKMSAPLFNQFSNIPVQISTDLAV